LTAPKMIISRFRDMVVPTKI